MKIFLDTDVILDFLGDRKPFSKHAATIFSLAYRKQLQLFTSSNSITTTYYLLSKIASEKQSRRLVMGLLKYMSVVPVTEKILIEALNSLFRDFEDGVQHFSALSHPELKVIVTRNLRDYSKSTLQVKSPEEFLLNIQ
jgi:predicted nucleic acid-binding protein